MSLELDQPDKPFVPAVDRRPRMAEPLPVRLVAVEDVVMPAPAGLEKKLDAFYVEFLGFMRDPEWHVVAYWADNARLIFRIGEPPVRHECMRAQQIVVLSLPESEKKLFDAEIEFERQRGLLPGQDCLRLRDPAHNWIELVEEREVS